MAWVERDRPGHAARPRSRFPGRADASAVQRELDAVALPPADEDVLALEGEACEREDEDVDDDEHDGHLNEGAIVEHDAAGDLRDAEADDRNDHQAADLLRDPDIVDAGRA